MSGAKDEDFEGSSPTHPSATQDETGYWRNEGGEMLPVSASDLERFTYCPLSWYLASQGHHGKSDEIDAGVTAHEAIHDSVQAMVTEQLATKRNLLIWEWWFSVILILLLDTFAIRNADAINVDPIEFSKVLAIWALSCLVVGVAATLLPWRKVLRMTPPALRKGRLQLEQHLFDPLFEPDDFKGGWFEGGRTEVGLFLSAIVLAVHSVALQIAQNREQASYVMAVTTIVWMLFASFRLQRALISNHEAQVLASQNNLETASDVVYSDGDDEATLLVDPSTGLRGRPDQIAIIDGSFIPVEQKTGKVPARPHASHVLQALAYAALVEATTKTPPPYALLRYGPDQLHSLPWDDANKTRLSEAIQRVQGTMANGGARRNHDRVGKCMHCSRRYACPDRLTPDQ